MRFRVFTSYTFATDVLIASNLDLERLLMLMWQTFKDFVFTVFISEGPGLSSISPEHSSSIIIIIATTQITLEPRTTKLKKLASIKIAYGYSILS